MPRSSKEAPRQREALRRLARAARGGLISVPTAADVLHTTSRSAATQLASLHKRGWLRRIRRGLYLVLPLEAGEGAREAAVEDPWLLADALFAPCYIGGWSAVEHWGLSEQIFRPTFVVTAALVRSRTIRVGAAEFRVVRVPRSRLSGTTEVWRGSARVAVSDRERTLVDALHHPDWVGGVRHLAEILRTYHESRDRDEKKLVARLEEVGRGSAAKRLGYLAEVLWPGAKRVVEIALARRSAGTIKLDPSVRARGRLNKRWGLWVNVAVEA